MKVVLALEGRHHLFVASDTRTTWISSVGSGLRDLAACWGGGRLDTMNPTFRLIETQLASSPALAARSTARRSQRGDDSAGLWTNRRDCRMFWGHAPTLRSC